jgi:hypothetical protein
MKKVMIGIVLSIFLIGIMGFASAQDKPEPIGGQRDSHGCLGPAGYSWNQSEESCVREWENGTNRYQNNNSIELREDMMELREELRDNRTPLRDSTGIEYEQELRQNLGELMRERKGEYQFRGDGKNITITDISNDQKEILVEKINARTGLNLTVEDLDNKTALGVWLSNGRHAMVKIMPDQANERAIERLRLRVCNESNNCSIELKEVGMGNKTRLAYEISAEENSRFLFLFKNKMRVTAQIDGETGEVISVKKPWWSFLNSKSD